MSRGSDPGQIRAMLAAPPGYPVLDRARRRIGAFVELAGGDRIALRPDGVFVWRRRLLPITTVADVVPDQRAVVLAVEGRALAGMETAPTPGPGASGIAEEYPHSSGDWQDRIERYVVPVEGQAEQADLSRGGSEHERRLTPKTRDARSSARRLSRRRSRAEEFSAPPKGTLLFVSTPGGYALVEREGPPPPLGRGLEVPEQTVSFLVTKLGPSPLPNDPRICAYLEPTE